ncbi:E3 ubiquitin-protein ligase RNF13 [Porphyridium purpureum]|uniref:E3 ubiquitin-protein ligase RNF13 n=1 Tax=Porphyridium purpureum TaxID=35688 RepID=A0A5J4YUI6_PORPP|nr:E3 ubiquitin-protein ligase RNF13 [Porphyridium purpureum]|eukprot:POR2064..scf229_5
MLIVPGFFIAFVLCALISALLLSRLRRLALELELDQLALENGGLFGGDADLRWTLEQQLQQQQQQQQQHRIIVLDVEQGETEFGEDDAEDEDGQRLAVLAPRARASLLQLLQAQRADSGATGRSLATVQLLDLVSGSQRTTILPRAFLGVLSAASSLDVLASRVRADAYSASEVPPRDVLTQQQVDRLPIRKLSAVDVEADAEREDADVCSICLGAYSAGELQRTLLPCRHRFHSDCVDEWTMRTIATCPICKQAVVPPQLEEV